MTSAPSPVRALVVEDDPDFSWVMTTLLKSEGYSVTVASDGLTALQRAASDCPDFITLDLQLPLVSGDDLLRELRARQPTTPVIVVSGEPDAAVRARALGATAVFEKPFRLRDLVTTLTAVAPAR